MIRSSQHSIKFTNPSKLIELSCFINYYRTLVQKFVNILWNSNPLNNNPKLLDSEICNKIYSPRECDSRIKQCAAKQACSMVNGTLEKRRKQLYKLKELQKSKLNTKYLQRKIDQISLSKPDCSRINIELDSRFIDFQETQNGHFDLFIQFSQLGSKDNVRVPIKYHKTSLNWNSKGILKKSIRLSPNNITLFYEIIKKEPCGSKTVGADQGVTTVLSLSDNQVTKPNKHGYDYPKINQILSRRKKGSKGFKRTQEHRENYINWSINQLNFKDVRKVKLEKLQNMRKGKNSGRYLSHFAYTLIEDKLIRLSETEGFEIVEQDNRFRSQRCSECGWVHGSNRLRKVFKCKNCTYSTDADLNASYNHEIELPDVKVIWNNKRVRKQGFYWNVNGFKDCNQEPIVPEAQKTISYSLHKN